MNQKPVDAVLESSAPRVESSGLASAVPATVMFAVPRVPASTREHQASGATVGGNRDGFQTVPIIEPDGSPLQNFVQNGQQRFVNLMGGSRFWRLFVGGGFAVLVGAVTLLVLEPRTEKALTLPVDPADLPAKASLPADVPIAGTSSPTRSEVQLVVNETDGAPGQQPGEFMDPFIEENLVTSGVEHAVHHQDANSGTLAHEIRQVANQSQAGTGPAWLSGTIEADDVVPRQLMRNHERSRPSHR